MLIEFGVGVGEFVTDCRSNEHLSENLIDYCSLACRFELFKILLTFLQLPGDTEFPKRFADCVGERDASIPTGEVMLSLPGEN